MFAGVIWDRPNRIVRLRGQRGSRYLELCIATFCLGGITRLLLQNLLPKLLPAVSDPLLRRLRRIGHLVDHLEAFQHPFAVGDLDRQAGTGVELQEHGAALFVQNHVDSQVAQTRHVVGAGGDGEDLLPVGDLEAVKILGGIGVMGDGAVVLDGVDGVSGDDVDSDPDGPLVEVGLAVAGGGGEAHHRHHRVAPVDDDPHVGNPLVAETVEDVVELYEALEDRHVILAPQGVEAAEGVGDVAFELRQVDHFAAGFGEALSVVGEDHQDSLAPAPLGRLDDESLPLGNMLVDLFDLHLGADGTQQVGNTEPMSKGQLLGLELVVHEGVEPAVVVAADVVDVAAVHPQDPQLLEDRRTYPLHHFRPSIRLAKAAKR